MVFIARSKQLAHMTASSETEDSIWTLIFLYVVIWKLGYFPNETSKEKLF